MHHITDIIEACHTLWLTYTDNTESSAGIPLKNQGYAGHTEHITG